MSASTISICEPPMDSRSYLLFFALLLSVAPAVFSLIARSSIKRTRQSHIRSLDYFFSKHRPDTSLITEITVVRPSDQDNGIQRSDDSEVCFDLVRSLEFLKFKYELPHVEEGERDSQAAKPPQDMASKPTQAKAPTEIEPHAWMVSGLLLVLVLLFFLSIAAIAASSLLFTKAADKMTDIEATFTVNSSASLVLIASIAGAYIYMVRAFYQAVNNFDLEPSSFFGAASNFIFAVAVTQIAVFYLAKSTGTAGTGTALLMIAAFIGAYMPDDILRYFLSLSSIKQLKRERSDFAREIDSIPIEVLDGIDSKVRYRLSDFHIESVQHLASTNPLMLFVETPYGFYQSLDWVAQAQLCASVGPDALFKLWKLGIRTIFDLERAVLPSGFVNDDLVEAIERILLPDLKVAAPAKTPPGPKAIVANVRIRVDGSDTRRLRMIVNCLNKQLGRGATALVEPRSRLACGDRHRQEATASGP